MNTSLNQGNQLNQERNTLIQNNNIEQQNLNNVSKINNEESSNRIDFMNDIYDLKNSAKNIHESGLEKQEKLTNTLNTRLNQIHTDLYVSSDDLVALDSNLNQISNKDKILTAMVNIEDNSIVSNIKKMFNIPNKTKVINFEAKFYKTKYGYLLLYESPDSEGYKALYDNYFKKNNSLRIGSSICVAPFPFTNYKDKWVPLPLGLENTFIFPELDTDIKPSSNLFVYNDNINLKKPKEEEPLNYDTIEYSMNQDIQALYKDTGRWYPGNISKVNKNGTYEIKWLDDDDEDRSKNNKSLRPGFYINQKVKAEIKRNLWKEGIIQKILLSGKYTVKINDTNKNFNIKYESLKAIDKFKIIRDDPIEEPIETVITKQGPTDEEILADRRKNFIELKSDKIEKINLKQYDTENNAKFKDVPDDVAVNTLFKELVEDNKEGFINSSGKRQDPAGCVNQYKKIYDCETFEQDYINNETDVNSISEQHKIEQHIYGHVPGDTNNGPCFEGFTKGQVESILNVFNVTLSEEEDYTNNFLENSEKFAIQVNSLMNNLSGNPGDTISKEQLARVWFNDTSKTENDYDSTIMYIANELIEYVGFKSIEETDEDGVKQNVTRCFLFKNTLDNNNNITDSDRFKYIQDSVNGSETKIKCNSGINQQPSNYVNMGCWLNPTHASIKYRSQNKAYSDWTKPCSNLATWREWEFAGYDERKRSINNIIKDEWKKENAIYNKHYSKQMVKAVSDNKIFNLFGFTNEEGFDDGKEGFFGGGSFFGGISSGISNIGKGISNVFKPPPKPDYSKYKRKARNLTKNEIQRNIRNRCKNQVGYNWNRKGGWNISFWHPHAGYNTKDNNNEPIWTGWNRSGFQNEEGFTNEEGFNDGKEGFFNFDNIIRKVQLRGKNIILGASMSRKGRYGEDHLYDHKKKFFNEKISEGIVGTTYNSMINNKIDQQVIGRKNNEYKVFDTYKKDNIKPTNADKNGGIRQSNNLDGNWTEYGDHHNTAFVGSKLSRNYPKYKTNCGRNGNQDYMRIYRKRYPRFNDEKCNTTVGELNDKKYLNGNVFLLFKVNAITTGRGSTTGSGFQNEDGFTNEEGFTDEQQLNRFYGRVAFIDPFYNVYLYDSNGNFLEDVFQLYKAHEMKHFLTDYDVNAIQGGGKLFGTLGVPGNRGTEKINIATRNYTVTGPSKSDLANLERAIQVTGISRNVQTNTEGEFEVVKDKIHWGRSEKGDDKNGGPMMSIVNYREWNLINLYGQENQYSGTIIKSSLSFNEGSNREDNKIGRNPEREFFTNEGFSGGNYNKISTYDKTNMNIKNLDLERNLMTNNDIEINKDRNIGIKQTDIQMQNANNVILADEGKFMANALSKEAFTALEGFVDEEYNSDLKKGLIDQKDILAGDREKVRVLNTIKDHFNSQMTFEAIVEQTNLDVNSKKQWMYIWASAILLILTIKFFIMSKKS